MLSSMPVPDASCRLPIGEGIKYNASVTGKRSFHETQDCSRTSYSDRKRARRLEQNHLVAMLDLLLPQKARRGGANSFEAANCCISTMHECMLRCVCVCMCVHLGFKSAGPRSASTFGRSFFNVLVDTIDYLRLSNIAKPEESPKKGFSRQPTHSLSASVPPPQPPEPPTSQDLMLYLAVP
jgi:hypothetical protein